MKDTEISWCDDTINPWWGCAKVSPACTHCYAETLDARFHPAATPKDEPARALHWGPQAPRMLRVERAISELERSARRAVREGRRRQVFAGSMCDLFEDRPDLVEPRQEFLGALDRIQRDMGNHLDVSRSSPPLLALVLTKRPEVALEYARANPWPLGAWLGVTVEDQQRADERIPIALEVAALTGCKVFLSMEPLLGAVDLDPLWCDHCGTAEHVRFEPLAQPWCIECDHEVGPARWLEEQPDQPRVSWVIVGGESGHRARPMHPEWARSLRDQCMQAGVPFHFKQWGEWAPHQPPDDVEVHTPRFMWDDTDPWTATWRLGKKAAGRLLDGRTHDDVPR